MPGDIHWPGAFVLDIARCTQIGIRLGAAGYTVGFELADKQQNVAATFHMMDIALASGRVLCCGTLALPMEQALVDGVVVVHGRG